MKARSLIEGFEPTNENYSAVVKILKEHYGDDQAIIDAHYSKLLKLEDPKPGDLSSLVVFKNQLEMHFRELEVLNVEIEQPFFISLIRNKLPVGVRIKFEEMRSRNQWSVNMLREMIQNFIRAREAAEIESKEKDKTKSKTNQSQFGAASSYRNQNNGKKPFSGFHNQNKKFNPTAGGLLAGDESKIVWPCVFCQGENTIKNVANTTFFIYLIGFYMRPNYLGI